MNTIIQCYREQREKLMNKWEKECRDWLEHENGEQITATFFKDGIIDPDVWYQNEFRPLFILKEVHDTAQENRCIDFVAMQNGKDYDIWEGRGMWRALGALAQGIISSMELAGKVLPYEMLYQADLSEYHKALRRIAIINIKKLSGGNRVGSDTSIQKKHFTCHACKFKEYLQSQINLIDPSIIVCCGADMKSCFELRDNRLFGFPVVFGLHPATNPNRRRNAFYNETINKIYQMARELETKSLPAK